MRMSRVVTGSVIGIYTAIAGIQVSSELIALIDQVSIDKESISLLVMLSKSSE